MQLCQYVNAYPPCSTAALTAAAYPGKIFICTSATILPFFAWDKSSYFKAQV